MFLALAGKRNVVILRFRVIQLRYWNDLHSSAIADDDPLCELPRRARRCFQLGRWRQFAPNSLTSASERLLKSLRSERLKQVIDRVYFECAQGMLVVGGGEDDRHVGPDQLQHFKAVELWHLDIQKKHVGIELCYCLHRFEAVGAFRGDFYFGMTLQKLANYLAREILVIDDDCANPVAGLRHAGTAFLSAGSVRPTWNRSPFLSTEKLALLP